MIGNTTPVLGVTQAEPIRGTKKIMEVIKELASNDKSYRSLTYSWFKNSPLLDIIQQARQLGFKLILTTDHGTINAKVVGEQLNELYSLSNSSVVTTNNLLPTLVKEQRQEQGTNAVVNIFNLYTDPNLRDNNSPNNHSSQAPIIPHAASGQPSGYITHKSNVLLGNATKGKTSRRYFRTLRNGKETDF